MPGGAILGRITRFRGNHETTHRRLLATILAVTALGISALVGAAPATADEPRWGAPYVAIGDSVASGNGLMPYFDPACLRSKKAYPIGARRHARRQCRVGRVHGSTTTAASPRRPQASPAGRSRPGDPARDDHGRRERPAGSRCSGPAATSGRCRTCAWALMGGVRLPRLAAAIPAGIADGDRRRAGCAPERADRRDRLPDAVRSVHRHVQRRRGRTGTPMKFARAQAALINQAVAGLNHAVQGGIGAYQAAFSRRPAIPTRRRVRRRRPPPSPATACATPVTAGSAGWSTASREDRGLPPERAGQQAYAATIAATLAGYATASDRRQGAASARPAAIVSARPGLATRPGRLMRCPSPSLEHVPRRRRRRRRRTSGSSSGRPSRA